MPLIQLDHVNLRTAKLLEMIDFYRDVLGVAVGDRPPFDFGGAWLYCGSQAVVHLVEVKEQIPPQYPRLEHFALQAQGLEQFLNHLRTHRIAYRIGIVPEWNIRQVNIHDPDGNHLHIDFAADEQADCSDYTP